MKTVEKKKTLVAEIKELEPGHEVKIPRNVYHPNAVRNYVSMLNRVAGKKVYTATERGVEDGIVVKRID